jgi:hypothetical protein
MNFILNFFPPFSVLVADFHILQMAANDKRLNFYYFDIKGSKNVPCRVEGTKIHFGNS